MQEIIMNIEEARENMIAQQVRAWEVHDNRVLALLEKIPREHFVPKPYQGLAFADLPTPIGHGKTMLPPKEHGRILQALNLQPTDTVLEVGTGSGYLTALMAMQAQHVFSVDVDPEMTALAAKNLKREGIHNVTLETGDALHGWPAYAPYDAIVFTGALHRLSDKLANQLQKNGQIFAILGDEPAMEASLIRRKHQRWDIKALYETVAPRLQGADKAAQFIF